MSIAAPAWYQCIFTWLVVCIPVHHHTLIERTPYLMVWATHKHGGGDRAVAETLICVCVCCSLALMLVTHVVILPVHRFSVQVQPGTKLESGPASLHLCSTLLVLTRDVPPIVIGQWKLSELRRYGAVPEGFVFEGGSRCGQCECDQSNRLVNNYARGPSDLQTCTFCTISAVFAI